MIDKFCVKAGHINEWQRRAGAVTDSYKIVFLWVITRVRSWTNLMCQQTWTNNSGGFKHFRAAITRSLIIFTSHQFPELNSRYLHFSLHKYFLLLKMKYFAGLSGDKVVTASVCWPICYLRQHIKIPADFNNRINRVLAPWSLTACQFRSKVTKNAELSVLCRFDLSLGGRWKSWQINCHQSKGNKGNTSKNVTTRETN